ncbi:MAG: hypothetical protein AAGH38_08915, partial [Pseudomonadota bacterium]
AAVSPDIASDDEEPSLAIGILLCFFSPMQSPPFTPRHGFFPQTEHLEKFLFRYRPINTHGVARRVISTASRRGFFNVVP